MCGDPAAALSAAGRAALHPTGQPTERPALPPLTTGALSAAPAAVESLTHLTAFRGFAGTSVLIMVRVMGCRGVTRV